MEPGNRAPLFRPGVDEIRARDLLIVVVAAAARLVLFSGFIGGDDFAYAHLAHEILERGYPPVGPNVFASRPLFVTPIAASVALLGWSELAIVVPVFLASLWGIVAAYVLGALLGGRRAAVLSAATLAVFPLDLVYATTTTNDIVGSAILATAAALGVASLRFGLASRHEAAILAGLAGGVVAGIAPGAKLSFILGWVPFGLAVALTMLFARRARVACLALVGGFACGQALLLLFFRIASGGWLDNYTVELGFNRAFMAAPYLATRGEALLSYPSWVFGIRPALPDNDRFFPYGLFFPLVGASLAVLVIAPREWRGRAWFPALWFAGILLLLEFWPLRIAPYTPIHRLPRFLHLAAVPGAVLVGMAWQSLATGRARWRIVAATLWAVYALHAVASSVIAVERHRDSMADLRFAADVSSLFPGPIVTDSEMRGYLMFRRGFQRLDALQKVLGAQVYVPPRSMVIAGGGRRIDMDPEWAERRVPAVIPVDWIKLANMPGGPRPWRRSRGSIYLSGAGEARIQGRGFSQTMGPAACAPGHDWILVDVIDVGEPSSESAHAYRIEGETFSGKRMLFSQEQAEFEDDGRAFRGGQAFDVLGLRPGVEACVVKRLDPSPGRQVSRWLVDQSVGGELNVARREGATWIHRAIGLSGRLIAAPRVTLSERVVSADVDVNAYLIEVYQPREGGAN